MIQPRGWQQEAIQKFEFHRSLAFLLEATPGAGKTIFAALCAKGLFDRNAIDFAVIVVPTTALKGDSEAGFLGDWSKVGVMLTSVLKAGAGFPKDFRGGIVTYQQLPNIVGTIEEWSKNGARLMFVFDEVHHASEDNRWGAASESAARCAAKVLAMTGTPFRGDGRRISFVTYNDDDVARPDHRYSYRQAVSDRVCRPVVFMTDDGIAEYVLDEIEHETRISEASNDSVASRAAGVIFRNNSEWLQKVLVKADAKLDEYRIHDIDAGGLVICRPGADDGDDRHLQQVAKMVREVTGEAPTVITHDDPDANAKIEAFRKGSSKWLCSVRKVSEGVDIKRLRVEVMANKPSTELLFRQLVGRVVRVKDARKPGDATIFLAKFPQLTEWAEKISEEAQAGLRDHGKKGEGAGEGGQGQSLFTVIGSTHEHGGAISDFGETYSADEIGFAESFKRGDPELIDIPVAKIAHVLRKANVPPEPSAVAGEPLYVQKKKVRESINRLVRQVAIQKDPEKPSFSAVWTWLHRQIGAKSLDDLMDNKSIDVMRQAEALLKTLLKNNARFDDVGNAA